jgi:hypothetical protein
VPPQHQRLVGRDAHGAAADGHQPHRLLRGEEVRGPGRHKQKGARVVRCCGGKHGLKSIMMQRRRAAFKMRQPRPHQKQQHTTTSAGLPAASEVVHGAIRIFYSGPGTGTAQPGAAAHAPATQCGSSCPQPPLAFTTMPRYLSLDRSLYSSRRG